MSLVTFSTEVDGRLFSLASVDIGIYVCEQLPGANSSPIVTKLGQSYPWPQGTRWFNFGRSWSLGRYALYYPSSFCRFQFIFCYCVFLQQNFALPGHQKLKFHSHALDIWWWKFTVLYRCVSLHSWSTRCLYLLLTFLVCSSQCFFSFWILDYVSVYNVFCDVVSKTFLVSVGYPLYICIDQLSYLCMLVFVILRLQCHINLLLLCFYSPVQKNKQRTIK